MEWNDKNVLITGISGFVGSYLARDLIQNGANVYGLIRRRSDRSYPKNISDKKIEGNILFLESGLDDLSGLTHAVKQSEPDYIFHLAAQSFVPRSISDPLETAETNCTGTNNLLEAVRLDASDPVMIFAGTSEEYGLVISSDSQYDEVNKKYGTIYPEPVHIPELPICETNPLRPMSPYAVSKVYGDFLFRNYFHTYGLKGIVSRSFNHEGAGRGAQFVTSVITNQVSKYRFGEIPRISIGNVNAFRDWSHVNDMNEGYQLIARNGNYGDVYNVGSQRTTSVLSYLLYAIESLGEEVQKICTMKDEISIRDPLEKDRGDIFGISFEKTKIDRMILEDEISFGPRDVGIRIYTDNQEIPVVFDQSRFRPAEVPILFSDITKIRSIGYQVKYSISDIILDQMNFFSESANRSVLI